MKKMLTPLSIFLLAWTYTLTGQGVPQGMKFQAVARDEKGQVLADRPLDVRIQLYSQPEKHLVAYAEVHHVTTNTLGLFTLTIGEGEVSTGSFAKIPWSDEEIWMEVALKADDSKDFVLISDSKMLSVPYAFHAATADELSEHGASRGSTTDPYGKVWTLLANYQTIPGRDKLGTGDMADLVIVTNNTERMRVLADGDIAVLNNAEIGEDLSVVKNVYLNSAGALSPTSGSQTPGETVNFGNFTVENQSKTLLTGALEVDGATNLHSTLDVDGAAEMNDALVVDGTTNLNSELKVLGLALLNSTLDVNGATTLNNTLDVDGLVRFLNTTESTTTDNGALVVEGGAGIGGNINVGGSASFGGSVTFGDEINVASTTESTSTTTGALTVAGGAGIAKNVNIGGVLGVKTSNSGFAAKIENTNSGSGDGLEIKLGKTHPGWDGSAYVNIPNPGTEFYDNEISTIRGWIEGEPFQFYDVLDLVPAAYIPGTACNLMETLSGLLNDELNLPAGVPPLTDAIIFDAFNSFADPLLNDDWRPDNPTTIIPGFTLEFPENFCPDFLPSFSMPNINFADVNNSLKQENQFLSFKDNENRELGSVRALSVTEWGEEFFDGVYLVNFIGNTVSLDPLDIVLSCVKEFTSITDSYNSLGVEYASGHGDYAEWLERENPSEVISRGDIVAVKGGKITKDLTNAEQVMAVSAYPIVLGNIPNESDTHLGNNVAFMGQIPVKVMGPVESGDYIIADTQVPGYGKAKSENEMTLEDMPLVVGRSWETKGGDGPKMVNTVVGLNNSDYFRILKNYEEKLRSTEAQLELLSRQSAERMETLEARVDLLMQTMSKFQNE